MLKFIRAGMYTSVQDGGREGQRQWGISRCGALDKPAMTIANLLVGNAPEAAALEITLGQIDGAVYPPLLVRVDRRRL